MHAMESKAARQPRAPSPSIGKRVEPRSVARADGWLAGLIRMQQSVGNQETQRILHGRMFQPERLEGGMEFGANVAAAIAQARGGGRALDIRVRVRIESSLAANLGGIRIHTDRQADRLARLFQARALTTGRDIFFREGAYDPDSPHGLRLLAHEATHTAQQASEKVAGRPVARGVLVSSPSDRFEQAADRAAERATLASASAPQSVSLPKGRSSSNSAGSTIGSQITIQRQGEGEEEYPEDFFPSDEEKFPSDELAEELFGERSLPEPPLEPRPDYNPTEMPPTDPAPPETTDGDVAEEGTAETSAEEGTAESAAEEGLAEEAAGGEALAEGTSVEAGAGAIEAGAGATEAGIGLAEAGPLALAGAAGFGVGTLIGKGIDVYLNRPHTEDVSDIDTDYKNSWAYKINQWLDD